MSLRDPDPLEILLQEVQKQFEEQTRINDLLALSEKLQAELRQHMISSPQCMLPSFNYELPTGQEQGTYLALEVGGSNLRVALVELNGRKLGMRILRWVCFAIETAIRQLKEYDFFEWMAERVGELLKMGVEPLGHTEGIAPLSMGVAWSFPIESVGYEFFNIRSGPSQLMLSSQTSMKSGNVLGMGKGFHCSEYLIGRDLGDIITRACQRAVLALRVSNSCGPVLIRLLRRTSMFALTP